MGNLCDAKQWRYVTHCKHDFKHACENVWASNFPTVHIKMRVEIVSWCCAVILPEHLSNRCLVSVVITPSFVEADLGILLLSMVCKI